MQVDLAAVHVEELDVATVRFDVRANGIQRLLREDLVVDLREVVHREQRPRKGIVEIARGDSLERRPVDRVDELEEQQRPLVALALQCLDQRHELCYGRVEVHTASSISSSMDSINGLKPSPQPSSPGSTSTMRTSFGSPPS